MTADMASQLHTWLHEFSDLGFCLTFSRGKNAEAVMRAYGMDPARARVLSLDDMMQVEPDEADGTVIRFGQNGSWGYSLEYIGIEGGRDPVLSRLSEGSETVVLGPTARGMTLFHHARDGVELSSFEPMAPHATQRGPGPHLLADLMQEVCDTWGDGDWGDGPEPGESLLRIVQDQLGELPGPEVLGAPALTAYLADADRLPRPPPPPPTYNPNNEGLGRRLGGGYLTD